MGPIIFYTNNLSLLSKELILLSRRKMFFGVTRFGTLAAIIIIFYFFSRLGGYYVGAFSVCLLLLFRWLVLKDLGNQAAITNLETLIRINKDELKALKGEYGHFANGNEYLPKDHVYANDIDIMGPASLYQFCNRTTSGMGGKQLAAWLLHNATPRVIKLRQQSIKELANKRSWAQQLQSFGSNNPVKMDTYFRLNTWLHQPFIFLNFKHWKWLRIVLPIIIVGITLAAIAGWVQMGFLYGSLLLFAVVAFQLNKVVAPLHEQLAKMVDELQTLTQSIGWIEKENFESPLLQEMQQHFQSHKQSASISIRKIKKILDQLDLRYNIIISAPLNLLFLWNLQQVLSLEKWKKIHSADIDSWFVTLGEFEALNSFATLSFNNADWIFPILAEHHFEIEATTLGHPLINNIKRVNNDIKIDSKGKLMIVTGSNMAGKSTYLRSVGINIILAMAGAPVCATFFRISPVQLLSSMRVADNLEENTSTFYAELKKLKLIIDKVNNNEKIFILLDEILRGTNSIDRHTGSVALVKQFIKHNAAGIIATHDVALAEMKKEYPDEILNYHFDAHVSNDELYFDYKLKPGISTSLNASILMKKIGIEL